MVPALASVARFTVEPARCQGRDLAAASQEARHAVHEGQVHGLQGQVVPEAIQPRGPDEDAPLPAPALDQRRGAVVELRGHAAVGDMEAAGAIEVGLGEIAGAGAHEGLEDGVVVVDEAEAALPRPLGDRPDRGGQEFGVDRRHRAALAQREEEPAAVLDEGAQAIAPRCRRGRAPR